MSTATSAPAAAHSVDTTKVEGRRPVRYESFDDLLADAERLASGETRTLGNWTLGQILDHLAKSIHAMIDGPGFSMPLPMRFIMRLTVMKKMVNEAIPPGFKFPAKVAASFQPVDLGVVDAIESLRVAIDRAESTPERGPHPAFGRIPREDWDRFQLRHCEMHMSFVVPN